MDNVKAKVKIGADEIEIEGPAEFVGRRLEAFENLVHARTHAANNGAAAAAAATETPATPSTTATEAVDTQLGKIMRVEERVVSLTVRARSEDDAILLILYGQRVLRNNEAITGFEVARGLEESGQPIARPDRILERLASEGNVIATGQKRGKKYRINNQGIRNARGLAADLIQTVA